MRIPEACATCTSSKKMCGASTFGNCTPPAHAISVILRPMPALAHYSGSGVFKQRYWFLQLIALFLILFLTGCSSFGVSASNAPDPGGGGGGGKKGGRRGGGGDVPVTVSVAVKKDVPVEVQVIG